MSSDHPAVTAAFLRAMEPGLKRLLASYRIPPHDAEDVLQKALLALVYRWEKVRTPETWLLSTLKHHCQMYWREQRRRLYVAVDSAILEFLSEPKAAPQEREELLCDLRKLIRRLPPRCRALLELRFGLGYEPSEAARELGYRDSSIGKITNRCLAALTREMLASGLNASSLDAGETRRTVVQ